MNPRLTVLVTIAVGLAALAWLLQRMDEDKLVRVDDGERLPRYTLLNAELTRYDGEGQPAVKATAEQLQYFDDESADGTNMVVDVLSGTRNPWHATAPVGHLPAHEHAFVLREQVVADGQWPDDGSPLRVTTTELWVDPDQHELHTDAKVVLTSATRTGTAIGMRSNWQRRDLYLQKDVHVRYDFKDKQ